MDIKVSIIVPVYNTEKYLERCLNSLIHQTLKEIEIICIDDGSTDSSKSILEKFASADNRIKILNQENEGPSVARNNGINCANGEYIGFVDSDDYISENFFELLYNNAKKYNTDVACGEIERPNSRKHKKFLTLKNIKVYHNANDKYKACDIPRKNYIWNKIYKRSSLIDSKIVFEPHITFEDLLWTHRVINELNTLVTVPKAIYYYFETPNSITLVNSEKNLDDFYNANRQCIEYSINNRIKIKDFKAYRPQKRIRVNLFGIRIFDLFLWDCVKVFFVLGIPILKIYVTKRMK